MKCVSIVYKRPTSDALLTEFIPIRSVKRSVDQYIEKLKEKQEMQKQFMRTEANMFKLHRNTEHNIRTNKYTQPTEMTETMNIAKMKYSCDNIFRQ